MTTKLFWRSLAGALAAIAICGSAPAEAAPKSPEKAAADVRARELYKKGDKDYAEGRYEDAFAEFQEAYDLSSRAQLLFNIANAAERLGKYQEAVDALNKYLQSGKAGDKDVVQKRISALQKRIDDKKAEDDAAAAEKKRQDDAAAAAAQKAVPPPPPPKPPEKPFPVLPVALMAAGGAALVASGVFGILTLGARSDENSDCRTAGSSRLCDDKASSAISHDKTFGLVTDIALVGGLVLGGVGAYFLITGKKSSVDVTPTGRGAYVVGTF